jgi:hypothetical protein
MDNKELSKLLLQLLDQIKNTQAVDDEGRKLLHDLEGDIHALIEHSEEIPLQMHPSGVQNLESGLTHFEVTHPEITLLISNLLNFLSNSGI